MCCLGRCHENSSFHIGGKNYSGNAIDEIASIKNYLELEKIRYGEKAAISFIYEEEDSSNYFIPPLIFIPFLENAFKHGLSNSIQMGYVNVKLSIKNKMLD